MEYHDAIAANIAGILYYAEVALGGLLGFGLAGVVLWMFKLWREK